jgi:CRISPR system Cascade subunit CasE
MSLFDRDLPGEQNERRATSNILFRLESGSNGEGHVLLQSSTPALSGDLTSTSLDPLLEALETGVRVVFRIDINPVTVKSHSNVRKAVPDDLIANWFVEQKMQAAFTSAEVRDIQCDQLRLKNNNSYLRIARIDGTAEVGDADALREQIRHGVGRAKAYGCGMLSVAIL